MPHTRQQSTPSNDSSSGWDSDSDLSALNRSPSPACEEQEQEYIPRPPNRFILYRANAWKEREAQLRRDNITQPMTAGAFGQYIGPIWRSEPEEVKDFWEAKAKEALRKHKAMYPDYVYRPNRGSRRRRREEEARPKRAPCKPKSRSVEGTRKEVTLSPTRRTMKTRSMTQQRQAAAVRTSAREKKVSAGGSRSTTTPCGNPRPTKTTTRRDFIDLTSDSDGEEDVQVQGQNQNAPAGRPPTSQDAVHPSHVVGAEAFPSTVGPIPVDGGIFSPSFDLPVGGGFAPVDQALPAHLQSPNAFDENFEFVPSNSTSDSEWTEHDRPSLWDSDLPLFPPEILEDNEPGSHYQNQVRNFRWTCGIVCVD